MIKNSLSQVVDATILETRALGVTKDKASEFFSPGGGEAGADSAHGFRMARAFVIRNYFERKAIRRAAEAGLHPRHSLERSAGRRCLKRGKLGGGGHEARGAGF